MKKLCALPALIALALSARCITLADEMAISPDDLMGVWVRENDPEMTLLVLPGEYAHRLGKTATPELFVEINGPESDEWFLIGANLFCAVLHSLTNTFMGQHAGSFEEYTSYAYNSGSIASRSAKPTENSKGISTSMAEIQPPDGDERF